MPGFNQSECAPCSYARLNSVEQMPAGLCRVSGLNGRQVIEQRMATITQNAALSLKLTCTQAVPGALEDKVSDHLSSAMGTGTSLP